MFDNVLISSAAILPKSASTIGQSMDKMDELNVIIKLELSMN